MVQGKIFFFFVLYLFGVGLASARMNASISRFPADLKPCRPAGVAEELLCGKLTVFENREAKKGRTINLNIVVLPSVGKPKYIPLFDLEGGPGMPDTKNAGIYANDLKQYREGRDIVLVDQRGTGKSNPLDCPRSSTPPAAYFDEMYPIAYVRNCRNYLEKKADLRYYTTETAMDDLDDIRAWLGYKTIDLIGISYGTRAAQVFARRHPDNTDRIVLIGALGTYHKMPFYHAPNAQRALDLLLDECLADKGCKYAFPNIRQEIRQVIERLRNEPKIMSIIDPASGIATKVAIRADEFAETLRSMLYSRVTSQQIPFVAHSAALGNFAPFVKRVVFRESELLSLSDGMYLSVTCAEDVPFIDEERAAELSRNTIFGNYRVRQQKRACSNWVRGSVSKKFLEPVKSDVRALIISGNLDPVTAPSWGTEIIKGFRNGRQIIVPELAHAPDGLSNSECIDVMIMAFLDGTPAEKVDGTCSTKMMPSAFIESEIQMFK
jgi:Predicted hydrolases or acyltransferases (alpha/beta hydrolase superfamily)